MEAQDKSGFSCNQKVFHVHCVLTLLTKSWYWSHYKSDIRSCYIEIKQSHQLWNKQQC